MSWQYKYSYINSLVEDDPNNPWRSVLKMSDILYMPYGYDANKTAVNDTLLRWITDWSDSHCVLQQRVTHTGVAYQFRMYCIQCKDHKMFEYRDFLDDKTYPQVMHTLETFCRGHRHEVRVTNVTVTSPGSGYVRPLRRGNVVNIDGGAYHGQWNVSDDLDDDRLDIAVETTETATTTYTKTDIFSIPTTRYRRMRKAGSYKDGQRSD